MCAQSGLKESIAEILKEEEPVSAEEFADHLFDNPEAPIPEDEDQEYSECLNYLTDRTRFKTFGDQLKDVLEKYSLNKSYTFDEAQEELAQKFAAYNHSKVSEGRTRVHAWLDETNPPDRDSVIKIIFALGLNKSQANELLRKGCHDAGLNIRNARDAILLYCLLKHRPYSSYITLCNEVENKNAESEKLDPSIIQNLAKQLTFPWKDDEHFYNDFLLHNTNNFDKYVPSADSSDNNPSEFKDAFMTLLHASAQKDGITPEAAKNQLIENLASFSGATIRTERVQLQRWLERDYISPTRASAIKIAFAFHLNEEETNKFLAEGCHKPILNCQNAEDAVFLYGLLNNRPYTVCHSLYVRYQQELKKNKLIRSNTTQILYNDFAKSDLETDAGFLKTFLNSHEKNFIGYSKTAFFTYCSEYITISLHYIDVEVKDIVDGNNRDKISKKLSAFESLFARYPELIRPDGNDLSSIWYDLRLQLQNNYGEDPLKYITMMREILPQKSLINKIYEDAVPSYTNEGKIKPGDKKGKSENYYMKFSESSLKKSFFDHFVRSTSFSMIESQPQKYMFSITARKTIILFSLINCYWNCEGNPNYEEYPIFAKFYNDLNDKLLACGMAPLYYGHPFDWLIARSAMEYDQELTDPVYFLKKVLNLSFMD